MEFAVLLLTALVLGTAGLVFWLGRRHGWRWGVVHETVTAGAGPGAYREGTLTRSRLRGTPASVTWGAGIGIVWGVLTCVVLAPAGCLLCLVFTDRFALGVPLLLAVCLDGFALGVALVAGGIAALRADAQPLIRRLAVWTGAHHLAVMLVFVLAAVVEQQFAFLIVLAALPCVLGVLHALLLWRAGGHEPRPEQA